MAELNTVDIREMTDAELEEELDRTRQELFRLKFRSAYQELENPGLLRSLRRQVARLLTIRHERRLEKKKTNSSD